MKLGQNVAAAMQRPSTPGQPAPGKANANPNAGQRSFQELLTQQKSQAGAAPASDPRSEALAPPAKIDAADATSTLQLASKGAGRTRAGT